MLSSFRTCCKCIAQAITLKTILRTRPFPSVSSAHRYYSEKKAGDKPFSGSFESFKDSSRIIFDVDEEKQLAQNDPNYFKLYQGPEELLDEFEGLNLERGITGVYDIEDLVEVLNKQKALDIAVIFVPPEYSYVDFIVVVTGKSYKHMLAMASFVRRVFKKKYEPDDGDKMPRIEGEESNDWIAMDLGNIAVHIFSSEAREKYDLESLWCLGKELDSRSNEEDELISLLEQHSLSLADLKPVDEMDYEKK